MASIVQHFFRPLQRKIIFPLLKLLQSTFDSKLAYRQPATAGLILESGIADPAERFLTYADLSAAGIEERDVLAETERHFNHKRKLSEYRNPLLVTHTKEDGLLDISHAERNYRWAGSSPKRLLRFPVGNHNTILAKDWNEYMAAVDGLVSAVRGGAATSTG